MSELVFDCLGAEPDLYGAMPTINFQLRISETTGERVHAIALRIQMRIEPKRRRYSNTEGDRLLDLFGEKDRWGDTVKPMQFCFVDVMVPSFTGAIELDIPVACTYDLEVSSAKYFRSLDTGEIPLLMLFSGTVFTKGSTGFSVEQVPWHKEVSYGLPVKVWDELMEAHFPGSAWIRMSKETLDALGFFKSHRALTNWDETLKALLAEAGETRLVGERDGVGGVGGVQP
jgi:hypothetical protein